MENTTSKITEKVITEVAQAAAEGKSLKEKVLKGAAIVGAAGVGGWVLLKVYRHFRPKCEAAPEAEAQA